MSHQAADHGNNRHIALHLQSQLLLQGLLAGGLAPEVPDTVMGREYRVRGRVEYGGINTVYNAAEFFPAALHHGLHPLGIGAEAELPGIGGTDGGDGVGAEHRPLHEVHAAVHLQGAAVIPAPIQAE